MSVPAGNDIRSVINTLQFASSMIHGSKPLKLGVDNINPNSVISSMLLSGLKDISQDIFQLWNIIFCVRDFNVFMLKKSVPNSKNVSSQSSSSTDDQNVSKRAIEVMNAVYGHDDYDLL